MANNHRITLNIGRRRERTAGNLPKITALLNIRRLWPHLGLGDRIRVQEVMGKTGEPTFVVSFNVPNFNNFDTVTKLAEALHQDVIPAQYNGKESVCEMCGPGGLKYGRFNQALFTTEEEAEMMSHPKAHEALNTEARIAALEQRVYVLEKNAEAKRPAGWMAGAGSAKPAPEKKEPQPDDLVQVTLTRHVAEKIGRLLYCHISGDNSIDMNAEPFAVALGVHRSTFRRFKDAQPSTHYKDGHVLKLD